jgi:tetratricopeptide (TPR) repeat protein
MQDPVNALGHFNLAAAYRYSGRLDEAITELRNVLRLRPDFIYARTAIAEVLLWKHAPEAARQEVALETDEYSRLYGQALVFHATRQEAQSERAVGTLISKYSNTAATGIATVYAFRGEADRAFAWLEKAARAGDPWLGAVLYDPLLASLHTDERWTSFLREHGMAPEQLAAIKFDVAIPN